MNILFGIRHLQEQQLSDDQVGHHVVNRSSEEYDPIDQQSRIDIVTAFATAGLLHDHRH
jgi:hypothetical protein